MPGPRCDRGPSLQSTPQRAGISPNFIALTWFLPGIQFPHGTRRATVRCPTNSAAPELESGGHFLQLQTNHKPIRKLTREPTAYPVLLDHVGPADRLGKFGIAYRPLPKSRCLGTSSGAGRP